MKFTKFCSFIVQLNSFNPRQIDRQVSSVLIILKLTYFGKNNSCKMEVLQILGSWNKEIYS